LTFRAWEQALLFDAQFAFTEPATGLAARGSERVIRLTDRSEVSARAVIVATGVAYRRLGIGSLDRFIGAGIFYGAAGAEAPAMAAEQACVVGGANSAGQADLHLARFAARLDAAGARRLAGRGYVRLSDQTDRSDAERRGPLANARGRGPRAEGSSA
jgi:thioredoxin reductase (NADPH)